MIAQPSETNASCRLAVRSYRVRSRRNRWSHAKVLSTGHRCLPSPLPCSMYRLASFGVIPRLRMALRNASESYARSASSALGRLPRARPRRTALSSVSMRALLSCVFAPVTVAASGVPSASVTTWCFVPGLARSVGFGPVFFPPAHRPQGGRVCYRPRPVDQLRVFESLDHDGVHLLPNAGLLPFPQPAPTRHAAAAPHFLRQILPGNAGLEDEDNAGEDLAVGNAFAPGMAPRAGLGRRDARAEMLPQFVGNERLGQGRGLADQDDRRGGTAGQNNGNSFR